MAKKLYVGNLPFSTTEDELRAMFEEHGSVQSCNVITDRETGRSRGFAFVEMDNADAAMESLDGKDMGGRALRVNEANDRRGGAGGGGGGGGYGGGRGGGGGGRGRY